MFIEAKVKNILAKTKAGLESTKDDNPLKANLRKMIDDINKQYFGEPQSEKPQEQPQAQAQPQPQTVRQAFKYKASEKSAVLFCLYEFVLGIA